MSRFRWRIRLAFGFVVSLLRSNADMTAIVARPAAAHSAVIAIELQLEGEWEITALADLVSLSPGTLALGATDDRRRLYVYVITNRSLDQIRSELMDLQQRIMGSTR